MGGGHNEIGKPEADQHFRVGLRNAHHPLGTFGKGLFRLFAVLVVGGDRDGIMTLLCGGGLGRGGGGLRRSGRGGLPSGAGRKGEEHGQGQTQSQEPGGGFHRIVPFSAFLSFSAHADRNTMFLRPNCGISVIRASTWNTWRMSAAVRTWTGGPLATMWPWLMT